MKPVTSAARLRSAIEFLTSIPLGTAPIIPADETAAINPPLSSLAGGKAKLEEDANLKEKPMPKDSAPTTNGAQNDGTDGVSPSKPAQANRHSTAGASMSPRLGRNQSGQIGQQSDQKRHRDGALPLSVAGTGLIGSSFAAEALDGLLGGPESTAAAQQQGQAASNETGDLTATHSGATAPSSIGGVAGDTAANGVGGGEVSIRVRGSRFRHVTSRGQRNSVLFKQALIKDGVLDGRLFFSRAKEYPSSVSSVIKYDLRVENAIVRERQAAAAANMLLTPATTSMMMMMNMAAGQGAGAAGSDPYQNGAGVGGPNVPAWLKWKGRSYARLLHAEFSPCSPERDAADAATIASSASASAAQTSGGAPSSSSAGGNDGKRSSKGHNHHHSHNHHSRGKAGHGSGAADNGVGGTGSAGSLRAHSGHPTAEEIGLQGGEYHPTRLDPPSIDLLDKSRLTYNREGYLVSILTFRNERALKDEINERFAAVHPWLDFGEGQGLTLSKIRSLKKRALELWWSKGWELSTVALGFVSFERLALSKLVNKGNRKLAMAACLLLAYKFNEAKDNEEAAALPPGQYNSGNNSSNTGYGNNSASKGKSGSDNKGNTAGSSGTGNVAGIPPKAPFSSPREVVADLETAFSTPRATILKAEFPVFMHLRFSLKVPAGFITPHMERLLTSKGFSLGEYLGHEAHAEHVEAVQVEEEEKEAAAEAAAAAAEEAAALQLAAGDDTGRRHHHHHRRHNRDRRKSSRHHKKRLRRARSARDGDDSDGDTEGLRRRKSSSAHAARRRKRASRGASRRGSVSSTSSSGSSDSSRSTGSDSSSSWTSSSSSGSGSRSSGSDSDDDYTSTSSSGTSTSGSRSSDGDSYSSDSRSSSSSSWSSSRSSSSSSRSSRGSTSTRSSGSEGGGGERRRRQHTGRSSRRGRHRRSSHRRRRRRGSSRSSATTSDSSSDSSTDYSRSTATTSTSGSSGSSSSSAPSSSSSTSLTSMSTGASSAQSSSSSSSSDSGDDGRRRRRRRGRSHRRRGADRKGKGRRRRASTSSSDSSPSDSESSASPSGPSTATPSEGHSRRKRRSTKKHRRGRPAGKSAGVAAPQAVAAAQATQTTTENASSAAPATDSAGTEAT